MPTSQDLRLGTTAEAARILNTHPAYLARLAKKGVAPVKPLRLGRVWRWPLAQLEAFARAGRLLMANSRVKFHESDNPRHVRVLRALRQRSLTREEVDAIAGASNGPETISEIRNRELEISCTRAAVQGRRPTGAADRATCDRVSGDGGRSR